MGGSDLEALVAEVRDIVDREYLGRDGPSSTEAGPEARVTRYGRLDFPGQVPLQKPCQLTVTVNRQKVEGAPGQVELGLRAVEWPLQVVATVKVRPEDFRVEGPSHGVIEVPKDADSEPLTFVLFPLSLGEKTIRVKFEQNNTYLNTAFIASQVIVASAAPAGTADVEGAPTIGAETLSPEVTIYIDELDELTYTVRVRRKNDAVGDAEVVDHIRFPKPPDQYMAAIFADLDTKTKTGLTADEFEAEVKKIGNNLYDDLFDEDGFKAFYWEHMAPMPKGSAVQIVSEEPWIPWEMLRPFRQRADGFWESDPLFLCERFALSRWLEVRGLGPATRLPMQDITVVVPPSNLPFVKDEVQALEQFPNWRLQKIQDKAALEEFFQHKQANIVHFACHGKFQEAIPERSIVLLGDKRLSPRDVTAEYRNFARAQPLVFLNACDSGRQGLGLTGVDGWATAFLEAQVGVFVGSVWKTTDSLASLFATTFYRRLQAGETVGEAVRRGREAVKRAGDATYLSYTLYANPLLKAALAD
jgi:hypothetical protein